MRTEIKGLRQDIKQMHTTEATFMAENIVPMNCENRNNSKYASCIAAKAIELASSDDDSD
jgi:hypothetical protein